MRLLEAFFRFFAYGTGLDERAVAKGERARDRERGTRPVEKKSAICNEVEEEGELLQRSDRGYDFNVEAASVRVAERVGASARAPSVLLSNLYYSRPQKAQGSASA